MPTLQFHGQNRQKKWSGGGVAKGYASEYTRKIMSYKVMVRKEVGIQQLEKEVEKSKSDYEVTCLLCFLDVNVTVEIMKNLNK